MKDFEILTEHQRKSFTKIYRNIVDICSGNSWDDNRILDLQGFAGTGKTFGISILVKALRKRNIKVKITTPTHKSLGVALNMLRKEGINIEGSTIHSHLSLKQVPANKPNIDYILKMDPKAKLAKKVDLLIVDESSMVSDELYKYVLEHLDSGGTQCVLFVGDPAQLLPVDGDKNPIYSNRKIEHYKLTEVVRQAKNNPIIFLATEIREAIDKNKTMNIKKLFTEVPFISNIEVYEDMKTWMGEYIKDKNTYKDKQMIAFSNKTVDAYNEFIRSFEYQSNNLDYLINNENVIMQNMVTEGKEVLYRNGETVTVINPVKKQEDGMTIWCYNGVKTVDPVSVDKYNQIKEDLKNKAIKDKKMWFLYYQFIEKYTEIKRIYACTLHKSQGSGWNNVYLNIDETLNYMNFVGRDMVYRLLYVGLTRTIQDIKVLI